MKNERKLSTSQICLLIATGAFGLLAMLFGIACIMFDHLMEGTAIVMFDIVLVTLLVVMIRDNKPKVKGPNLGTKVFVMRGVTAAFNDAFGGEADVTLMTDGILIESIGKNPCGYGFDEISMFSSDRAGEFSFAVMMEQSIALSGLKQLHVKALTDAFRKHGVRGILSEAE